MPRRNPSVRIFYWILVIGIVALIIWRVRVKRRRERERLEAIRREMIRKKKIAMKRAEEMKRAKAQGNAPVRTQTAKPVQRVSRPVQKTEATPVRKVRK